jgi:hypothetical protein
MKHIIIIAVLFFSVKAFSQCPQLPKLKFKAKTIQDFIPKGWYIMDSAKNDFNNDGLQDVALVIANTATETKEDFEHDCNRALAILQKTTEGYLLNSYTNSGVLCKNCGGVFGDPYNGINLKDNILSIQHFGGSAWRWSINYTFRFQKNTWQLIGLTYNSFFNASDCNGAGVGEAGKNIQDVNFSTSKVHLVKTKETNCKPYKDITIPFKKKPLIDLKNFDVEADYFPLKND